MAPIKNYYLGTNIHTVHIYACIYTGILYTDSPTVLTQRSIATSLWQLNYLVSYGNKFIVVCFLIIFK